MEINYQDYNENYGEFSSDEEMEIENELRQAGGGAAVGEGG